MLEETLTYVYTWAVYMGLFVTTCLGVSSMLFLMHYMAKSIFFWKYKVISEKMTGILMQVMNDNRGAGGNAELCFLAGALLMVLRPEHFTKQTLDELKEELQLTGNTEISEIEQ